MMVITWLIVSQLVYFASLILWAGFIGLFGLAWQQPEGVEYVIVASSFLYPIVVVTSTITSWLAYRRKENERAISLMLVPAGYAALAFMVLYFGGVLAERANWSF